MFVISKFTETVSFEDKITMPEYVLQKHQNISISNEVKTGRFNNVAVVKKACFI